jgi:hypothetical protein
MSRSVLLAALLLAVAVTSVPLAQLPAQAGGEGPAGQEVTFRGRAVSSFPPPGCADCFEGWAVDVQTVLCGPPIFGRVEVITGGGIWGCVGGYRDPRILPGDPVEVHGRVHVPEWPYTVFVCGGSPDHYIKRASAVSQRLFLPAVFARL